MPATGGEKMNLKYNKMCEVKKKKLDERIFY